mmetsp:Transcript_12429/g.35576  ORF Transcript_12429/g.35576 Transcript_12429/m.35576 type:complete len:235 (-) Transcript_12429:522-1226(-)
MCLPIRQSTAHGRSGSRCMNRITSIDIIRQVDGSIWILAQQMLESFVHYSSDSIVIYVVHCKSFYSKISDNSTFSLVHIAKANVDDGIWLKSGRLCAIVRWCQPFQSGYLCVIIHQSLHEQTDGHPVHVATLAHLWCVEIGMSIYPNHSCVWLSSEDASKRTNTNGMIAPNNQREALVLQFILHHIGKVTTSMSDQERILGIRPLGGVQLRGDALCNRFKVQIWVVLDPPAERR